MKHSVWMSSSTSLVPSFRSTLAVRSTLVGAATSVNVAVVLVVKSLTTVGMESSRANEDVSPSVPNSSATTVSSGSNPPTDGTPGI